MFTSTRGAAAMTIARYRNIVANSIFWQKKRNDRYPAGKASYRYFRFGNRKLGKL